MVSRQQIDRKKMQPVMIGLFRLETHMIINIYLTALNIGISRVVLLTQGRKEKA